MEIGHAEVIRRVRDECTVLAKSTVFTDRARDDLKAASARLGRLLAYEPLTAPVDTERAPRQVPLANWG